MRPTQVYIDSQAVLHNVKKIKQYAPHAKIAAMVKANAYGCGLSVVAPTLVNHVDAFGVACLEEAIALRALGIKDACILFEGIYNLEEMQEVVKYNLQCVIHHKQQLDWLLSAPQRTKIKVWVKVNTGMHRLGFDSSEVPTVLKTLLNCPWVDSEIGVMTHLSAADEPNCKINQQQLHQFNQLNLPLKTINRSMANSAAIIALPATHMDMVRPGIMLYGVSPFANQTGIELGLEPVMQLVAGIIAIHEYPAHAKIGYGGTWQVDYPTKIGVVSLGYGDGYPRHIVPNTQVWVKGHYAPIVGRVSMDMLTIDLTHIPDVTLNDRVELWGKHVPVESVARSAGTIGYELLCQVMPRVKREIGTLFV